HHPDAGRIELLGQSITGLSPRAIARRGLVRTFQTPQLFGDLSVIENVMVGAAGHRLGSLARALAGGPADSTGRRRAEAVMTVTALEDWADAPARALPFGLRRRLEIARALAAGAST